MSDYPVLDPGPKRDPDGVRLRRGGCGAVRFAVRGEPMVVGVCHCTECRKATGSAYLLYVSWPRDAFTVSGQAREFKGRSFCTVCGSRVFHLSAEKAAIMLGALDEVPSDLRPTREGWITNIP